MDKRLQFTGGEPDVRLDQILVDAEANRPAMHAMMKSYATGTNPNYIISGCVVTVGGASPTNTWSMTAGYIFLNDEIVQTPSNSGTFDSATEFLALSKTTTYNSSGNKTFIDGNPRQTWQQNRGTVTVKGSVATNELDALNGEHLSEKIRRYAGGGYEAADSVDVTIDSGTKWVDYTLNGPVTRTITIPDPDDTTAYMDYIYIAVTWVQGTVSIEQADSTVVMSGFSTSAYIILQNDGTTWNIMQNLKLATSAEMLAGTNDTAYVTPAKVFDVTAGMKMKQIDIGDWNMDSTATVSVAHALTYTDIRGGQVFIRDDADALLLNIMNAGTFGFDATNVVLVRTTSGVFDSTDYNSTSYNRGYITIWYE